MGWGRCQYQGYDPSRLNFQKIDAKDLVAAKAKCVDAPKEYLWSIHTKWSGKSTSGAYNECNDDATGKAIDAKTFTKLKPGEDGVFKKTWTENECARWSDQQPEWNIVIQAVCGNASTPVECASGAKIENAKRRKHLRVSKHVKGDYGSEENPHYDTDSRKSGVKGQKTHVKGDYGDEQNPHYSSIDEKAKVVHVKVTTHKKH